MSAQRGDYERIIVIKDENGTPIPWPSLDDYFISVYQMREGVKTSPLFTFKKGATGIAEIDIDPIDNTKAHIVVNRKLTASIPPKDLFLEVEIYVTQAGNYIGGVASAIETGIPLFKLDAASNQTPVQ